MIRFCIVLLVCLAGNAQAQSLNFPSNASLERAVVSPLDSYGVPMGIWENGTVPMQIAEGRVSTQAWRVATASLTTLQLLRPLREQLRNARYRVIFECQTEACGGFDFRFATDALPPPEMQINIGDYRFLSAERTTQAGREAITLFVSRTAQAGFVQVTHVGPVDGVAFAASQAQAEVATRTPLAADADLPAQLDTQGRAVLSDLAFATGSAQLGAGPFVSLQALADYLASYPDRTVALVGHTDAAGELDPNIALSKRRAASVLERLVRDFDVPRQQLAAEGMGYLSPLASNASPEGREANRRVEVIVTSTQD
jgi:OOP family OmpA-OmpF porin